MSTLENDIIDAIDKDLPAQVAGRLKVRLEKTDGLENQLAEANQMINTLQQEIADITEKLSKHEDLVKMSAVLDMREANIETRDKALVRREDSLKCELAEQRVVHAEQSKKELLTLVDKVMGHPAVTITRDTAVPIAPGPKDQYGNTSYGLVEKHQESETTTESKV